MCVRSVVTLFIYTERPFCVIICIYCVSTVLVCQLACEVMRSTWEWRWVDDATDRWRRQKSLTWSWSRSAYMWTHWIVWVFFHNALFQTRKWGENGEQNSTRPLQHFSRVAVPGNAEAVCASFGPLLSRGLLWAQKNVRGCFGNLPSAQDEWLCTEHTDTPPPPPPPPHQLSLPSPTFLLYTQRSSRNCNRSEFKSPVLWLIIQTN